MLSFRSVLAATAVTLALGAPAFAQNISLELSDRLGIQGVTADAVGPASHRSLNGHTIVMRHAGPVQTSVFYRSNSSLYAAPDGREQLVRTF
jgi:hypothetical protein